MARASSIEDLLATAPPLTAYQIRGICRVLRRKQVEQ